MSTQTFNRFFYISLSFIAVVFGVAMFTMDIIDIDSSQYAYIAKEMYLEGNYLEVYCRHADYLDKPPLIFWTGALSYSIFGIHDWAYRLPSVLALILAIYSLYRFARIYYEDRVAKLSALVMSLTVAAYSLTTDVRTDTLLTGFVLFSLWQLAMFNQNLRMKHLLLGACGIGLAMLAKGPIGLVIPCVAFTCEFAYKRQWKRFFRWQYLVAFVVIALILLPMSYGLYKQFDLHPEKDVYNLHGPSGLRFFYWTQSFGRITGENYWDNDPDPFFLYHSFLWSFMPWTVIFIPAIYNEIREKIRSFRSPGNTEAITVGGFVLILFFLSRSSYQLPHYTFVIHPLAALITAKYLGKHVFSDQISKGFRWVMGFQYFSLFVLCLVCGLLLFFVFPGPFYWVIFFALMVGATLWLIIPKHGSVFRKTVVATTVAMICAYVVLTLKFYRPLMSYQSDRPIAEVINQRAPNDAILIEWKTACGYGLDFYAKPYAEHPSYDIKDEIKPGRTFVVVDDKDLKECLLKYPNLKVISAHYDYKVTLLTPEFLNPATRPKTLLVRYVLQG